MPYRCAISMPFRHASGTLSMGRMAPVYWNPPPCLKSAARAARGGTSRNRFSIAGCRSSTNKKRFLDVPPLAALAADFRQGGGFQYTGAILPIDKVPEAWRKGIEIAHRYGMICSYVHQVLLGNSIMFGFNYSFNRADETDIEKAQMALADSNRVTLELGGMIWKGEKPAQQMVLEKMDPNTAELIKRVKGLLDPKGIMNPGNWERE